METSSPKENGAAQALPGNAIITKEKHPLMHVRMRTRQIFSAIV